MRVLTVGETMALLDPIEDGATYRLRIGGAESNFAVALARHVFAQAEGRDPDRQT